MDFDFLVESITPTQGTTLTINSTGALALPIGTTAQRPTPAVGFMRYNTDLGTVEAYINTTWNPVGTGSVTSVSANAPLAGFTITGSPITGSGSFTFALADDLEAIEGLSGTGIAVRTAANTWTTRQINGPSSGITITNADGVAGNITIALANDLSALEGISTTGYGVRTASDTWVTRSISGTAGNVTVSNGDGVSGNTVIDLPNVGSTVSNFFGKFSSDGKGRITSTSAANQTDVTTALGYTPVNKAGDTMLGALVLAGDPVTALGAATKQYVDNVASGLDPKGSARVGTTSNVNIASPGAAVGGATLVNGDRVFLLGQTDATQNGLWTYTGAASALVRAADADNTGNTSEVSSGMYAFIEEGSLGGTGWVLTTANPIVLGTTALSFTQFSGSGTYTGTQGVQVTGTTIQTDPSSLLRALHTMSTVGLVARTASGTVAARSVVGPTAGITVSNGDGVSGNPSISLSNDLAALEGLSGTGIAVRTAADTWVQRSITGTANQIIVADGDAVSANPVLSIAPNAVLPGSAGIVLPTGTTAQETGATDGSIRYNSTTSRLRMRQNGSWVTVGTGDGTVTSIALTGSTGLSVSGSPITGAGTISLTLGTELQGLSGLGANGFVVRTAAGTYANRAFVAGTGITLSNTNGVTGDITISNSGVTSVGLALPSIFTVTNSPVTSTGTITGSLNSQSANLVFAGPTTGAAAVPAFRTLVYKDLPLVIIKESATGAVAPVTSGTNSIALGSGSTASAENSFANGDGTDSRQYGGKAFANGEFATAGDAQGGTYVLRNITTDATVTELFLDGVTATQRVTLPNNSVFAFSILVVARRTDATGGSAGYKFEGIIKRDTTASTAAVVGNVSKTVLTETNTAWNADIVADTTNGSLKLQVKGEASKTVRWVATVQTVEVTN